jgi:hypothetical protein
MKLFVQISGEYRQAGPSGLGASGLAGPDHPAGPRRPRSSTVTDTWERDARRFITANIETGLDRTVLSNDVGQCVFPSLRIGQYNIKASLTGFATAEQKDLSEGRRRSGRFPA